MTQAERFLGAISFVILGGYVLALGVVVGKRKPVLVESATLWRAASLALVPLMVVFLCKTISESLSSDDLVGSLTISLVFIASVVAVWALMVALVTRYIWLFNVTQDMMIEKLEDVLRKRGIDHSSSRRAGPVRRAYGQSLTIVTLSTLRSSICITTAPLGRAWMRFRRARVIPDYDGVIADLKQALAMAEYRGATAAFLLIYIALLSIGGPIFWLIVALVGN